VRAFRGERPAGLLNACGDPGGIRTRDLDLERVAEPVGADVNAHPLTEDKSEAVTKSVTSLDPVTPDAKEPSQ
jgi:hypothetical protein